MRSRPSRRAVLISGRGSNLQALIDLGDSRLSLVISSKADAPGLRRARRAGIPTLVLPKKIDWSAVDQELRRRGITQIFLAGFMRLLPEAFVRGWSGRILNVHPSLLPAYPGLSALEKSHSDRAPMGVTVHVVVPEMDAGPVRFQKKIAIGSDWPTLQQAQWRISQVEQRLVREAWQKWN